MPRGVQAKALRAHNRACAAGRSTRGSSQCARSQKGGKKYKKGETSQVGECSETILKTTIYGGVEYQIIFKMTYDKIIVKGIYDKNKITKTMGKKNFNANHAKITDERMMKNIIGMHMLQQDNPELYEQMKSHDIHMIM